MSILTLALASIVFSCSAAMALLIATLITGRMS